jgi:hypothetical protein
MEDVISYSLDSDIIIVLILHPKSMGVDEYYVKVDHTKQHNVHNFNKD